MKTSILFQRGEAILMLVAAFFFYAHFHGSWFVFVPVWFAFDLSMVGYALGPRIGAYTYNSAHSLAVPATLFIVGTAVPEHWAILLGLISLAHISLDRLLGYGLKENDGFTHTHLGLIGPSAAKHRASS